MIKKVFGFEFFWMNFVDVREESMK